MKEKDFKKVLTLAGTVVITGCTTMSADEFMASLPRNTPYPSPVIERPARVDEKFLAMVGKPVGVAFVELGQPASSYAQGDGWHYTWDLTSYHTFRGTEYVQTGSECTSQIVGMSPGGNGIASMPIYSNTCKPVGYNQEVQKLGASPPCFIGADTDNNNIITKFDLRSCGAPRQP